MPPPSPSQKVQGAVARDTPGRDLREPPWDVLSYGSLHLLGRAGGGGIGPPGIPAHYPQRRLDRDPGTGSPVWIPLARTKTVSWLHKRLKIQRFPTEIRPDHDITFPKCKHYFLCADEDRCFTENAKKISGFLGADGKQCPGSKGTRNPANFRRDLPHGGGGVARGALIKS